MYSTAYVPSQYTFQYPQNILYIPHTPAEYCIYSAYEYSIYSGSLYSSHNILYIPYIPSDIILHILHLHISSKYLADCIRMLSNTLIIHYTQYSTRSNTFHHKNPMLTICPIAIHSSTLTIHSNTLPKTFHHWNPVLTIHSTTIQCTHKTFQ